MNGMAPKVKERWYGDHKYRHRRELKGESLFTFDELYITPFTLRRYSEDGRVTYVPVELALTSCRRNWRRIPITSSKKLPSFAYS